MRVHGDTGWGSVWLHIIRKQGLTLDALLTDVDFGTGRIISL